MSILLGDVTQLFLNPFKISELECVQEKWRDKVIFSNKPTHLYISFQDIHWKFWEFL